MLVRALLAPDLGGFAPGELVARAARELPSDLFHSILAHQVFHSTTFEALVPALAELLAASNDQPLVSRLLDWAGKKRARLERVIGLLERAGPTSSRFGGVLLGLARERLAALPAWS